MQPVASTPHLLPRQYDENPKPSTLAAFQRAVLTALVATPPAERAPLNLIGSFGDTNGDGSITHTDASLAGVNPIPHRQAAREIADLIHDSGRSFALIGESHSATSDKTFYNVILNLRARGGPVAAAMETWSSPRLDGLVEDLYAGKISREDFRQPAAQELFRIYEEAADRQGVPQEERSFTLENAAARIEADVLRYHKIGVPVIFADADRFEGTSRSAGMAARISRFHEENPNTKIVAQLGAIHAAVGNPGWVIDQEKAGLYAGVRIGPTDDERPVGVRLEEIHGESSSVSILLSQYDETERYYSGMSFDGPAPSGNHAYQHLTSPFVVQELDARKTWEATRGSGLHEGMFDGVVHIVDREQYPLPRMEQIEADANGVLPEYRNPDAWRRSGVKEPVTLPELSSDAAPETVENDEKGTGNSESR
jgi:hypothetical protein